MPVLLSGELDASEIVTASIEADHAGPEHPNSKNPPKPDTGPKPEKLEESDLASLVRTSVSAARIAVEKNDIVLSAGTEDTEAPAMEEPLAKTPPTPRKEYIIVKHYNGKEFLVPWALCQTWKGVESFIKFSYGDKEQARTEIDEGKYEICTTDGTNVFHDHWDMLVEPKWKVIVRLESQTDSPSSSSSDASSEASSDSDNDSDNDSDARQDELEDKDLKIQTVYTTKVDYTITYFEKDRFRDRRVFLYRRSTDKPMVLERLGDKPLELPVLEEETSVTIRAGRDAGSRERNSRRTPKLQPGDVVNETRLHIHSPFLLNALQSIIKYSSQAPSGDATDELKGGVFPAPYADLFYHKQELADYKKQATGPRARHTPEYNAECDRHIDFLLKYLDQEPRVQVKSLEDKWAKKVPTTTFAGFWLLVKPGSDVYVREDGQLNAYVVDSVSGGVNYMPRGERPINAQTYHVKVWNLKYDGQVITRMSKKISVPVFDNEREIVSLPIAPTRFHDKMDGGARRRELIERGKKLFTFSKGPTFLEYTGLGLKPGWKKYNRARVIVEHESCPWDRDEFESLEEWDLGQDEGDIGASARAPRCECSQCQDLDTVKEEYPSATFSDYDDIDPNETSELSDHQYMLCMSHMFGFMLKDRSYDLLDVSGLVNVKITENAMDHLVLRPEENKDTIKAIVKTYVDSAQAELFSADFIHGKGEGQIFLLHGPPGTGKTLTAESVAEYVKRPLLSITAADLGHEPTELEKNLLQFFKNASTWDAIVLLDEADVYLEQRSVNDLRRNSIVSIFLRALDYFQGILFLTTNRVGHFDEAFMSRIHVSIGYERLDDKARETIWDNLFRKLKEDHKNGGLEIRYEYDAKQYVKKNPELKELRWNGREIRNAFQTAVALAIFEARAIQEKGSCSEEDAIPEVKEKHLSQVVSMSAAFKTYMTDTHGGISDEDIAFKLKNRKN
ncbi:hypothetical protein LRP88_04093 [Fusarium phalaenopsidis]